MYIMRTSLQSRNGERKHALVSHLQRWVEANPAQTYWFSIRMLFSSNEGEAPAPEDLSKISERLPAVFGTSLMEITPPKPIRTGYLEFWTHPRPAAKKMRRYTNTPALLELIRETLPDGRYSVDPGMVVSLNDGSEHDLIMLNTNNHYVPVHG
jgi:hypothetical protein